MTNVDSSASRKISEGLIVSLRSVCRSYDNGRIKALDGVTLDVVRGDFFAVMGPSGCGKSTLLNMLGALDRPDTGEVYYAACREDSQRARAAFRARHVGWIFQSFHLLPTLTALENVEIPMFEMGWSARERRSRAERLLGQVGLQERMDHPPHELSGGERQRVAVARSLANGPELILADEPTGNLDSESAGRTLDLLESLHQMHGITLVVVTHDQTVASRARKTIHMRDGRIVNPVGGGVPSGAAAQVGC